MLLGSRAHGAEAAPETVGRRPIRNTIEVALPSPQGLEPAPQTAPPHHTRRPILDLELPDATADSPLALPTPSWISAMEPAAALVWTPSPTVPVAVTGLRRLHTERRDRASHPQGDRSCVHAGQRPPTLQGGQPMHPPYLRPPPRLTTVSPQEPPSPSPARFPPPNPLPPPPPQTERMMMESPGSVMERRSTWSRPGCRSHSAEARTPSALAIGVAERRPRRPCRPQLPALRLRALGALH